ncbi:multifunctional CCA protein [Acrasis kona]|uniref:Multifunctional CCA protein n=1 Tax=Acrasis kona TaxID=1008807 RepID=A0AAW2YZW5_9EUKA
MNWLVCVLLLVSICIAHTPSEPSRRVIREDLSGDINIGRGKLYVDFERRLLQMNLLVQQADGSIMSRYSLMTKLGQGKKSYLIYAVTESPDARKHCELLGNLNVTNLPETFIVPQNATSEYERKNGEHCTRWSFAVENPKPSYALYEHTKIHMLCTLYLSRFDQSIVHFEVSPSPLDGGKLTFLTYDVEPTVPNEFLLGTGQFEVPQFCKVPKV